MRIVEIAAGTPFETDPVFGIGHNGGPSLNSPAPRPRRPRVPSQAQTVLPFQEPLAPRPRRQPEIHDPDEHGLTVNEILHPDYAPIKNGTRKVPDIAKGLMNRGQTALKKMGVKSGRIEKPDPRTDEIISRAIASEVKSAITRDKGKSAIDWYTKSVQEALTVASVLHPELRDPNMKMAFIAALAITSQGEKVIRNVDLADQVFTEFKKTGKFPIIEKSKQADSMNFNFKLLNNLIDKMGVDGTRQFLETKFSKNDLERHGFKINGENADSDLYGSMIFGPKIGQGFYQNLNGNYDPVTMDLWFMRAWGRLTGTLVGNVEPKVLNDQQTRLTKALEAKGIRVPKTKQGLVNIARQIMQAHEKVYAKYKDEYKAKIREKEEIVHAADRYLHGLMGVNETPSSGGHRAWMRARVNRAREILAQQGINITNADLQAIWWYPEKELYSKLGGKKSDLNLDYAVAFKKLAQQKGYDDATINTALQSLGR